MASAMYDSNVPVNGKLDLMRSLPFRELSYPIVAASTIPEEGLPLVAQVHGGVVHAKTAAGAANERFLGVSKLGTLQVNTLALVYDMVVPEVAPYTIQLHENNLVPGQIRVRNLSAGAELTETDNAPNDGNFKAVDATGELTFNATAAGKTVRIWVKYQPTAAFVEDTLQRRPIGMPDGIGGTTVTAMQGGEIATMQYDSTALFEGTDGGPPVKVVLGNGMFTTAAKNANGTLVGIVKKAPTPGDPYLIIILNNHLGS